MVTLTHEQAILFRLLVAFFGEDRVIPHMSAIAVCGGQLPQCLDLSALTALPGIGNGSLENWAQRTKCLFTIVNHADIPRLVIELVADMSSVVDVTDLERQRALEPVLQAAGVPYLRMSHRDLCELAAPGSKIGLCAYLEQYFEETDPPA